MRGGKRQQQKKGRSYQAPSGSGGVFESLFSQFANELDEHV